MSSHGIGNSTVYQIGWTEPGDPELELPYTNNANGRCSSQSA